MIAPCQNFEENFQTENGGATDDGQGNGLGLLLQTAGRQKVSKTYADIQDLQDLACH